MDRIEIAHRIKDFFCEFYQTQTTGADLAFCFGRKDPIIAQMATALYNAVLVPKILFTGGAGKDSGDLKVPEAVYLAEIAKGSVPAGDILIEPEAKNGGENSRLGMKLILDSAVPYGRIILVGYWASLVRLWAAHLIEAEKMGFKAEYQLFSWSKVDKLSEKDVTELIDEFRRLIEWPGKGWAVQLDLPVDLVAAVQALPK